MKSIALAITFALAIPASAWNGADVQRRVAADASRGNPVVAHIIVALCDNLHQGIVPVPAAIGNGQAPNTNLYWGAGFGVRTFLSRKAGYSLRQLTAQSPVLDRAVFHRTLSGPHPPVSLVIVAEAWDGSAIAPALTRFLRLAAGHDPETVTVGGKDIQAGGHAAVVAFVGHNRFMDFSAPSAPRPNKTAPARSAIVLACQSKPYFSGLLATGGSHPLLLTTGLMAPEAYTLEAALRTFAVGGSPATVRQAAAAAYDHYQHCGASAARRLFSGQD